jgi:hypothetical protein
MIEETLKKLKAAGIKDIEVSINFKTSDYEVAKQAWIMLNNGQWIGVNLSSNCGDCQVSAQTIYPNRLENDSFEHKLEWVDRWKSDTIKWSGLFIKVRRMDTQNKMIDFSYNLNGEIIEKNMSFEEFKGTFEPIIY